ncbi:7-cyano-7-deazaguanine synthase QueC [Glycocaulis profundi]|nr:7-cyano-7-deazaguanine synthase QueC [Glycocaulis profundi]
MALKSDKALVLFSGGQDSATCLAWALDRFGEVETIGFDYGQRHRVELEARLAVREAVAARFPAWGAKLGPDRMVDLSGYGALAESALTGGDDASVSETGESGLPKTFVPGRNLVFLTVAGAHAWLRKAGTLVTGVCQTDYSGYPDCRQDTIDAQARALSLGLDVNLPVQTPLMHLTKAETWALAHDLGGDALVDLIVEESHTCYRGTRGARHDWGHGCGACPACELRAKGWTEWREGRA